MRQSEMGGPSVLVDEVERWVFWPKPGQKNHGNGSTGGTWRDVLL